MFYQRSSKKAPFDDARKAGQKGPTGLSICRWCGRDVIPPRRNWCSDECVHQRKLRTNTRYLREVLFEREQGVCQKCGLDTKELVLERWLMKVHPEVGPEDWEKRVELREVWHAELRQKTFAPFRSLWEADHILEVWEGGGNAGISNLMTLCQLCHREKTRLSRKRKLEQRLQFEVKMGE